MILAALLLQAVEPQTAIEAERAFAQDAQELGQWTAFEKWADENAYLIGRRPINAKQFASSQADPDQSLRWWPVESFLSCDGNTAINIGGWSDPASGASGQFHTVWQRSDGKWRYMADIGSIGTASLPDTGAVKTKRASCSESSDIHLSHFTGGWTGEMGSSQDSTLHWSWAINESGAKTVSWDLWNGIEFEAYSIDMPPPEPEPAQ